MITGPVYLGTFESQSRPDIARLKWFGRACVAVVIFCIWVTAGLILGAALQGQWLGLAWLAAFTVFVAVFTGSMTIVMRLRKKKEAQRKEARTGVIGACQELGDRT